jgi:predicted DNA-binding transcriptional regulator
VANTKKLTKSSAVTNLLARDRGATIAEIVKETGWQNHSVRAFLTGVRKTGSLAKEERVDGATAYCLTVTATSAPTEAGNPK